MESKKNKYPFIYEINTRVWINQFGNKRLLNVPDRYWKKLKSFGIDYVWLMGIWKTVPEANKKYCFEEGLIAEYNTALRNWTEIDVVGSPYAIDRYELNPAFGETEDIPLLKDKLHGFGLKLILDFIPNHFHAESSLLSANPDIFLPAGEEDLQKDGYTFFRSEKNGRIYSHGRDPFFPAWQDTVQINFASRSAREFAEEQIKTIADYADGLRCDMAMLAINNVFANTWGAIIKEFKFTLPKEEYWSEVISAGKSVNPELIFIAEAYWDLEWTLQNLGFDFTYDKKLYDRLKSGNADSVREHLWAEMSYQNKSVRFIENHDEERSFTSFRKKRAKAASVIMTTIPGMKLFFDGQFEGKKIKLPLQLGRENKESPIECMTRHYDTLLGVCNADLFKNGFWKLLEPTPVSEGDYSFNHILAWSWKNDRRHVIVIVNYSDFKSRCRLNFSVQSESKITLTELTGKSSFKILKSELEKNGLLFELDSYKSKIFEIN